MELDASKMDYFEYFDEYINALNTPNKSSLIKLAESIRHLETLNQEQLIIANNLLDNIKIFSLFSKGIALQKEMELLQIEIDELDPEIKEIDSKSNSLKFISIIPEKYTIPNTKLANELTKDFPIGEPVEINVAPKSKKKEITVYATLNYEAENITFTGKQINPYDRVVHNAVCSLYAAGNRIFTPEMVYRAMNGLTDSEKVSPESLEEVTQSIEKSRFIKVDIDYTQEMKAHNPKAPNRKFTLNDTLIAVKGAEVTAGGVTKKAYAFHGEPILYNYSRQIGQVISVPLKLLETKSKVRSTGEVIVLREYLLRRIEGMKAKNGLHSNKILYESIYQELHLESPTKQKSEKVRGHVKSILDYWVEEKYI